jgi:hypothetical protein
MFIIPTLFPSLLCSHFPRLRLPDACLTSCRQRLPLPSGCRCHHCCHHCRSLLLSSLLSPLPSLSSKLLSLLLLPPLLTFLLLPILADCCLCVNAFVFFAGPQMPPLLPPSSSSLLPLSLSTLLLSSFVFVCSGIRTLG